MKILYVAILFLLLRTTSFAQSNFYKFSAGGGVGATLTLADLNLNKFAFATNVVLDYNLTRFFSIGLELQKGELAGGDIIRERTHRQFINSFFAGSGNLRLQLGALMSYNQRRNQFLNAMRGLYTGIGLGVIKNDVVNVRYYGDAYYPGEDAAMDIVIPLNFGINFYIPDKWGYERFVINGNIQVAFTNGEGLDGYTNPYSKVKDLYGYYSIGFRYNFGPMGLDWMR